MESGNSLCAQWRMEGRNFYLPNFTTLAPTVISVPKNRHLITIIILKIAYNFSKKFNSLLLVPFVQIQGTTHTNQLITSFLYLLSNSLPVVCVFIQSAKEKRNTRKTTTRNVSVMKSDSGVSLPRFYIERNKQQN